MYVYTHVCHTCGCVKTYIHIYIYIYIHIHIYVYIHNMYIHRCAHKSLCGYINTYVYTHIPFWRPSKQRRSRLVQGPIADPKLRNSIFFQTLASRQSVRVRARYVTHSGVYAYIYICIHTYTRANARGLIYMYICIHVYIHTRTSMYLYMNLSVYVCIDI